MEEEAARTGHVPIFSAPLLDAIHLRLERGEQTILFLNRRGYSRVLECQSCGWTAQCPDCSVPYTYHQSDHCLRCHVCGGWTHLPSECPDCKARDFSYTGVGTQRAEAALRKCFPKAGILRMDADSTSRKNSHADILGAFRRREADILLGTQMIAKGLDFPNVTLVGVLNADSSLMMSDFRAEERTFQLLSQVAGRAGRAELPGEVVIQSRDPSQNAIVLSARGDYAAFAAAELKNRRDWYFPPYCRLSVIGMRSKDSALVESWAEMYSASLKAYAKAAARQHKRLEVGDAAPSAVEKADGYYRWQIVLRSDASSLIVKAWRWIISQRVPPKDLRVVLDVDAFNLA
jgi:primosomal protein N' (replication factor Y)